MKSSKYNIYTTSDDGYYVYNQLTGSFSEVDEELFQCLKRNSCLEELPEELIDELKNSHFICDEHLIEENVILRMNREMRYGNHNARITILPTVDCNFKCWYCYENHIKSAMNQPTVDAIILFIEKIFNEHRLQKKVERHCFSCSYDAVRSSLLNRLELVIKANRQEYGC